MITITNLPTSSVSVKQKRWYEDISDSDCEFDQSSEDSDQSFEENDTDTVYLKEGRTLESKENDSEASSSSSALSGQKSTSKLENVCF